MSLTSEQKLPLGTISPSFSAFDPASRYLLAVRMSSCVVEALSPVDLSHKFSVHTGPPTSPLRVVRVSDDSIAVSQHNPPDLSPIVIPLGGSERKPVKLEGGVTSYTYALETISPSSPFDEPRIVAGDGNSNIVVWHSRTGKLLCNLPEALQIAYDILSVPEWTANEGFVCGIDGVSPYGIRHFDWTKNVVIKNLAGHTSQTSQMSPDIERDVFVSASDDKTARIWSRRDPPDSACVATLSLSQTACSCYVSSDLHRIFVGCRMGEVEIWDSRKTDVLIKTFASNPTRQQIFGRIARVGPDTFVSASTGPCMWNSEGKIIVETINGSRGVRGRCHGIATMGTPYDRPSSDVWRDRHAAREEVERFEYLSSEDCPLQTDAFSAALLRVARVGVCGFLCLMKQQ